MAKKSIYLTWVTIISITVVVIAILLAISSLYLRNRNISIIGENISGIGKSNPELELLETSIMKLNEADNNFKYYALNYEPKYYREYSNALTYLSATIDSLRNMAISDTISAGLVEESLLEKIEAENSFIRLKGMVDSLQFFLFRINSIVVDNEIILRMRTAGLTNPDQNIAIKIDTVSQSSTSIIQTKRTPGLIGRLFGSKETTEIKKDVTIVSQAQRDSLDHDTDPPVEGDQVALIIDQITNDVKEHYNSGIKEYLLLQNNLNDKEKSLIGINLELLNRIGVLLQSLKVESKRKFEESKISGTENVSYAVNQLAFIILTGFLVIILLALLILFYLGNVKVAHNRLNEERIKAINEAKANEKFFAYLSHEMRTSLFTISGSVEQLKSTQLNTYQNQFIDVAHKSVDTLLQTVNEILDHSSLKSGKFKLSQIHFSIDKLIYEMESVFGAMAIAKGLQLKMHVKDEDRLVLIGDPYRLKQILSNLLSNALKYTNEGEVNAYINVERINKKAELSIMVQDTGIGISDDKLEHLFQEYSQVHDNSHNFQFGTGLGLSICKKLVDLHGGDIRAKSLKGQGSSFFIRIPYIIGQSQVESTPVIIADSEMLDLKGLKVLFVDDNKLNLMLFESMVSKWGLHYDLAPNGLKALDMIISNSYDLLLTDIYMPEMNGLVLTETIRKLKSPLKSGIVIIAVTASGMESDIEDYKSRGFNDVLLKPYKSDQLYNMLLKYFRK
jgi:signal transduction histidine kinase/CheY-like chemotaxis protein